MENEGNVGRASSSRWIPTKDQKALLENLYKEGIHTPSVDQIEQIAGMLRQYGHIEGKNVIYWFRNYKARQRRKQKQERIAYFNRLLHTTTRVFYPPPPCSNVGCDGPYSLQQVGDHHINQHGSQLYVNDHLLHSNNVMIPSGGCYEKPTTKDHEKQLSDITTRVSMSSSSLRSDLCYYGEGVSVNSDARRTLPLFPLHPLDDTQDNGAGNSSIAPGSDSPVVCFGDDGGQEHPFIDFFSDGSTR